MIGQQRRTTVTDHVGEWIQRQFQVEGALARGATPNGERKDSGLSVRTAARRSVAQPPTTRVLSFSTRALIQEG
jgi:hypothetical protein